MSASATVFSATGTIQTYLVPATGDYLIEACGAQSISQSGVTANGDRLYGVFFLRRGDTLKIVVGGHALPDADGQNYGGDGGSIVWLASGASAAPAKLLLAAAGGRHSGLVSAVPHESFNAGNYQACDRGTHSGRGSVSIVTMARASAHPFASAPGDDNAVGAPR